jgi:S1-C subfamily serine protease
MKKLFVLMCLAFFGAATCSSPRPIESPSSVVDRKVLVERLERTTVALVLPDYEGGLKPYCGGVWVASDKILTAHHCIEENPVIAYEVFEDTHSKFPKFALIYAEDKDNDLAMLQVDKTTMPVHPVADIRQDDVWVGEHVNIVGHTVGLWWTYIEGVVSSMSLREMSGKDGKSYALQISAPAWFGNSGGGAFDDQGRLLGISSFVSARAPNVAFFVHPNIVKAFVKKSL